MELINQTPFCGFTFQQVHRDGAMKAVALVRATFDFLEDGSLVPAETQIPIQLEDVYGGHYDTTALITPCDLVPFRPAADITVIATACAPGKDPEESWNVGVKVGEKEKALRVFGPRSWIFDKPSEASSWLSQEKLKIGWKLEKAQPMRTVRLSYEIAYGGKKLPEEGEELVDVVHDNPLGIGFLDPELSPRDTPIQAPSIEAFDQPVGDPGAFLVPQGFGPIPPWWAQRQRYVGTYDDEWLEKVHPRPPHDFDYRFFHYAHPDLIYDGYLKGDEPIQLVNLHPDLAHLYSRLPGIGVSAGIERLSGDKEAMPLNLDTLHFDLTGERSQVVLVWRGWTEYQPEVRRVFMELSDPARLQTLIAASPGKHRLRGAPSWYHEAASKLEESV